MPKMVDTRYTQDRELSWLRFDERVLEEARDEDVPLMERLKFAAIFTSNLDEFFMVRVGSLYDMTLVKEPHIDSRTGQTPEQQLQAIFKAAGPLYKQRDKVVEQLESRLRACNICRLSVEEMDTKERKQVENWFRDEVQPILSPRWWTPPPLPHLSNKTLNVMLRLEGDGHEALGLIPVPQSLPPYFVLRERGLRYILTEDVLLAHADRMFPAFSIRSRAVISVTRNADISPEDEAYEVDEDYRQHMRKIVKKRNRLAPVRLEVQGSRDEKGIDSLCRRLSLSREQVFFSKAPLRMGYVFALEGQLPPESRAALCFPPYTPRPTAALRPEEKVLPQVLRHDVLLFYPFQSMDPFLHLVREAASDPCVLSIKITIYRLAAKAKLAEYLCAAAENGKEVTVLMELRARFDEQNNIQWAERMEEAGCTILYGAEDIKVHSKICLITRRERGRLQHITQVGTGNYNEKTARQYTDLCLMTARPELGADAAALFQNLATANLEGTYERLLVSPYQLRDRCIQLIDREIAKGDRGYIFLKLNSITDRKLIDKLAQASQAGVEVVMNVRGICCLRPGIPGLTDRITVFSVVGRYLEHTRIYRFGRGEDADLFLSSADFMTRNTERRVEVACPILDPELRRRVFHITDVLISDNVKARQLGPDGLWHPRRNGALPCSSQEVFQQEAVAEAEQIPQHTAHSGRKESPWRRLMERLGRA
ncbi:MAG: polyphosphate kinase 1 [Oscillospiraceae bacterium]